MNVKDLKCYPQVVAVIGESLADYELQCVIDCNACPMDSAYRLGFARDDSPQGYDFWHLIGCGQNPYDHGHEKPEVKEWVYYDGEWLDRRGDYYSDPYGCGAMHKKEISAAGIPTHKSVTMPDWVPAELDKLDYNPEDVALNAKLVPEKITLSEEDFDNFVNKCGEAESSETTHYLPSLGEVCIVELGTGEFKVTIVGKKLNGCLIWEWNNLTDAYRQPEEQVGKFSPYISEEDKVLQKASSIISNVCLTEELKMLYDAGMLKLPEGE